MCRARNSSLLLALCALRMTCHNMDEAEEEEKAKQIGTVEEAKASFQ